MKKENLKTVVIMLLSVIFVSHSIEKKNIIDDLSAGSYLLSIYDSNHDFLSAGWDEFSDVSNYVTCLFEMEIILTEPNEIVIVEEHSSYYISDNFDGYGVSCYDSSDGFINIVVSGGEGEGFKFNYEYNFY